VEAANFAKRYDEPCRRWFDRKAARTSTVLATKALACKLAKAAWHVMNQNSDYDPKRMFPELAMKNMNHTK
jgi:transposase